jgi:hypothetical protein
MATEPRSVQLDYGGLTADVHLRLPTSPEQRSERLGAWCPHALTLAGGAAAEDTLHGDPKALE